MSITSCPNCGSRDTVKEAQLDEINTIEEVYSCDECMSEIIAKYALQDVDFTIVKHHG